MTTRDKIVAAARGWLNTPFHHQGRVKGVGVDCLQLLVAVYQEAGLLPADVDPGNYARDWHMHHDEERYLFGVGQYAKPTETPRPGDVALFKFGRCVSHAAIVIDWPMVIHAYFGQGVVEADAVNGAELSGRLHGFFTVVEDA